jgi:hypothetical protein
VKHLVRVVLVVAKVEVVLHAVADEKDTANGVGKRGSRRVLAEVTSLVASNEASGLNLGSGTARESGVEVHNALHASGILSGTDGLCKMSVIA